MLNQWARGPGEQQRQPGHQGINLRVIGWWGRTLYCSLLPLSVCRGTSPSSGLRLRGRLRRKERNTVSGKTALEGAGPGGESRGPPEEGSMKPEGQGSEVRG